MNELSRRARNQARLGREDHELVRAARAIRNEVRLAALEVDGAMALTDHIMDRATELNASRCARTGHDLANDMALAEFQATCLRQVKAIQHALYREV